NQAVGTNASLATRMAGLAYPGYIATGSAGFMVDQQPAGSLFVETTQGPITVSAPVALPTGDGLMLNSATSLAVNAAITVTGAGAVVLDTAYDTTTVSGAALLELSFGPGASLSYSGATAGQSLAINGQAFTLVYSMTDLAGLSG